MLIIPFSVERWFKTQYPFNIPELRSYESEANFRLVKSTQIKGCHPSFGSTVRAAHSSHTHRTIAV